MANAGGVFDFIRRSGKRIAITVIGFVLLVAGLAFGWLPIVPGFLLVFAGLAVLATEYLWARRMLEKAKEKTRQAVDKVRRRARRRGPSSEPSDGSGGTSA